MGAEVCFVWRCVDEVGSPITSMSGELNIVTNAVDTSNDYIRGWLANRNPIVHNCISAWNVRSFVDLQASCQNYSI